MRHLFSISSNYTVHGVHNINKLRIASARDGRHLVHRFPPRSPSFFSPKTPAIFLGDAKAKLENGHTKAPEEMKKEDQSDM